MCAWNTETILETPPQIGDRPNGICVDACIVDAIKMLWSHGVETRGCCCGHSKGNPSVVIAEQEDCEKVKRLLRDNDIRNWDVFQWRLVLC